MFLKGAKEKAALHLDRITLSPKREASISSRCSIYGNNGPDSEDRPPF